MGVPKIGRNPGHDNCIEEIRAVRKTLKRKYKYDFMSFLRLTTSTTTGIHLIKHRKSPSAIVRQRVTARNVKHRSRSVRIHAHFKTTIMHLKKKEVKVLSLDLNNARLLFQPTKTVYWIKVMWLYRPCQIVWIIRTMTQILRGLTRNVCCCIKDPFLKLE